MPRLFTAIEIPPSIRQRLALVRAPLSGAKWIEAENMHVTLRFAGDIDERTADEFAGALDARTRRLVTVEGPRKNSALFCALVRRLVELHPTAKRFTSSSTTTSFTRASAPGASSRSMAAASSFTFCRPTALTTTESSACGRISTPTSRGTIAVRPCTFCSDGCARSSTTTTGASSSTLRFAERSSPPHDRLRGSRSVI